MLRLGFELGCRSLNRPTSFLLRPTLLCSPSFTSLQVRSYAKSDGQELKKSKYTSDKTTKVAKRHFKSGTRLKRIDWLDTPRKPKGLKVKKVKPHHKLFGLNTDKRLTKYVNALRDSKKKCFSQAWVRHLAKQVKMSPENASTLTDFVLSKDRITSETYTSILDLLYRRKDLSRASQVFDVMKAKGRTYDDAYAVFAKILATRGELEKAKEILASREGLKGFSTQKTMINYLAAANLNDGVQLLEKVKSAGAKVAREEFSVIIGWALKHGDLQVAEKYYQEHKASYLKATFVAVHSEAEYESRLAKFNEAHEARHKALTEWAKKMREAHNSTQDAPTLEDVKKLTRKEVKKPQLAPLPPYPHRLTEEEFLAKFPVPFAPHLLRPLIDMEQAGQTIPQEWVERLSAGLKWKKVTKSVQGLAHKIYLKDKVRYEHLKNLLVKLGLPSEVLTHIPPARVKGKAPLPRKRAPAVTKWWKKGRTVFEKKD